MPPLLIACPNCKARCSLRPEQLGRVLRCGRCKGLFRVRQPAAAAPAPAPGPAGDTGLTADRDKVRAARPPRTEAGAAPGRESSRQPPRRTFRGKALLVLGSLLLATGVFLGGYFAFRHAA